jgi:sulfur transfer protein SufE
MTSTPQEEARELVETFEMFDEWEDRYRFLIDLGRELPPFDEAEKTDINKVHGCQSNVWLVANARQEGGAQLIDFLADSDAHIVRGLIAILRRVYSGRTAGEILAFDIDGLMKQLGLDQHLSISRRNGLSGMVARIKNLAAELAPQSGVLSS